MRYITIILLLLPLTLIDAQRIGELAPPKPPEVFPSNSWGVDVMWGEGGLGVGTFFRKNFTPTLIGFVDFSVSESKDDQEFEYIDYYGNVYVAGKKNRVFLLPLNFGLQYRMFYNSITDNLRPFINIGVGPSLVINTPYKFDFFEAFGKAETQIALGGYVGFGANFGLSKSNLLGVNVRYYIVHLFGDGVENMEGRLRKDLNHIYITLNIGVMY